LESENNKDETQNKYVGRIIDKLKYFRLKSPNVYFEIDINDLKTETIKQIEIHIKDCKSAKEKYYKLNWIFTEVISRIAKQAEPLIISNVKFEDISWIKTSINGIRELVSLKWKLRGDEKVTNTFNIIKDIIGYSPDSVSDSTKINDQNSQEKDLSSEDPNLESNSDYSEEKSKEDGITLLRKSVFDEIPDKKLIEFVIQTAEKTIRLESSLTKLILYSALSAYTKDPLNLGILAPTSEGKTYPVNETINFLPKQDVWLIGSMSPKVIIRDKGTRVDESNNPIEEKIRHLKADIRKEKDADKKERLKEQLNTLYQESRLLIDLNNKVLVFLEPPHQETWNILKPILSHDSLEIEHPYVFKTETGGQEVKYIITRGWPACIFCSAKDDSEWPMWPEIQSRFFITSPNMIKQKYKESIILIGQRHGLPSIVQDQLIVSSKDIQLAKDCVIVIKEELKKSCNNWVWIPYNNILSQSLPSEKGTDVRIANRFFSLLKIVTKINLFNRNKLKMGNEKMSISSLEDLEEVLGLTQNITGIPSYKLDFFYDIFIPLFKSKDKPDANPNGDIEEERIALTTTELSEYYKEKKGKPITTDNINKTYLIELKNNGLIDEIGSKIDKRRKIYYPIVDTTSIQNNKNYTNLHQNDENLQFFKLQLSKNYNNIDENWLEVEILALLKYGIGQTNIFQISDEENNELCICQFVQKYNKCGSLIRYFQHDENCFYLSKVFGKITKL
jgi:hypothetical protein